MTLSDLIDQLGEELVDPRYTHWSRESLLSYINQALGIMAINLPHEFRVEQTVDTEMGTVFLPGDALSLLSVISAGNRSVNFIDITKLNQLDPDWRTRQGAPSSWTQAHRDVRAYSLYPTPKETVAVTHAYSAFKDLSEVDAFPIHAAYVAAVTDYVLYRAYGKDGQNASEQNKALTHLQAFNAAIGNDVRVMGQRKQVREQSENKR
ncbi:DUF6682 family protein [Enterovibrio norvegicus]|uniref:phage adaptor protein n=1 Tax=Enterovibrio norvegicus TaxID=188144 RepID=UPI0024B2007F|nr:DUF6682 family protein [Enterovibrio norvegicus]